MELRLNQASATPGYRMKVVPINEHDFKILGKTDKRSKEKKLEDSLLQTIKRGKFEEIEREIKPKKLKYCESNSLLMGMKVRSISSVSSEVRPKVDDH